MAIVSSAPGEIFFFGEHSVVYGKLAIAASIGKRITAVLEERDDKEVRITSKLGKFRGKIKGRKLKELKAPKELLPIKKGLERVFASYGMPPGFELTIESEIPAGSGMASSAASSAAIIGAVLAMLKKKIPKKEFIELVFKSEQDIQGQASRTGPSCSVLGGVLQIRGKRISRVAGAKPMPIVIGYTGKPSLTSVTTARVKKLLAKDLKGTRRIFTQIEEIAKQGKKALVSGNRRKVGVLMNENQELLQKLGVSSRELDNLINAVRGTALGAKLTGGGGGGCMVALCNEEDADEVAKLIIENGGEPLITQIAAEGLKVERR